MITFNCRRCCVEMEKLAQWQFIPYMSHSRSLVSSARLSQLKNGSDAISHSQKLTNIDFAQEDPGLVSMFRKLLVGLGL